jgi:hypothetical protein
VNRRLKGNLLQKLMKHTVQILVAVLLLSTLNHQLSTAFAQGTAFTYQGRLNDNGNPANGTNYGMVFYLYDASTNGTVLGNESIVSVTMSNGLFNVPLDFGNVFNGNSRWLEIQVQKNGGSFEMLAPRQQITPTPYAITADNLNSSAQLNVTGLIIQTNIYGGTPSVIAGSPGNYVPNYVTGATIGGGGSTQPDYLGHIPINTVLGDYGTVGGGYSNSVLNYATVSGGEYNYAYSYGVVGGGSENAASGEGATVGGGFNNISSAYCTTVGGGNGNTARIGYYATVGGGAGNTASGTSATVPGGYYNSAGGSYSFAGGYYAQAPYIGDFVWSDESSGAFSATAANEFYVRAAGGVQLAANVQVGTGNGDYRYLEMGGGNSSGFLYGSYNNSTIGGDGITLGYNWYADAAGTGHVINNGGATSRVTVGYGSIVLAIGGTATAPGAYRLLANSTGVEVYGTFNNNSDRNAKQDFAPVSSSAILDKVLRLPLSEWSYQTDATTRHIGPMAQDFYATFNIGTDDKHIAPIDEGGVAFAAIQGLNQKLEDRDAKISDLEKRLSELEQTIQLIAAKK